MTNPCITNPSNTIQIAIFDLCDYYKSNRKQLIQEIPKITHLYSLTRSILQRELPSTQITDQDVICFLNSTLITSPTARYAIFHNHILVNHPILITLYDMLNIFS